MAKPKKKGGKSVYRYSGFGSCAKSAKDLRAKLRLLRGNHPKCLIVSRKVRDQVKDCGRGSTDRYRIEAYCPRSYRY